jgi:integrase
MTSRTTQKSNRKSTWFRIGRVRAFLRGRVWYLCYREYGQRRQPRVGADRDAARKMAAEINAQLETGAPSALGFEPISISELRKRWLEQHEYVRRSSLNTISRYRSATQHLIDFVGTTCPAARASDFQAKHAEAFVRYLRTIRIAPNGHRHAKKRRLLDSGLCYILETCATLFNYAQRHRHLSPYAENPFRALEISRIPIEDAKPVVALSQQQASELMAVCDDWQFPVFLTLLFTGLRPGELTHLLLPNDLDLEGGWLRVRNKPALGWQVKTRNQRDIPLIPQHVAVLRIVVGSRHTGPVFQQRRYCGDEGAPLASKTLKQLEVELARRAALAGESIDGKSPRETVAHLALRMWREMGATKADTIRNEFCALLKTIGLPDVTAPKTLRHTFATMLQDANVDPLVRSELMGHSLAYAANSGLSPMTCRYTHTTTETKRQELSRALQHHPALAAARDWCRKHGDVE